MKAIRNEETTMKMTEKKDILQAMSKPQEKKLLNYSRQENVKLGFSFLIFSILWGARTERDF